MEVGTFGLLFICSLGLLSSLYLISRLFGKKPQWEEVGDFWPLAYLLTLTQKELMTHAIPSPIKQAAIDRVKPRLFAAY